MPTTTRKAAAAAEKSAVVAAAPSVEQTAADASVGDDTPTPATSVEVGAGVSDETVVSAAELTDPRSEALAALLTQSQPVLSDVSPPAPTRPLPRLTGGRYDWHSDGDWYLVLASAYARVVDDDRQQLRAGDVVQLRDDDRTQADLAYGYLVALPDQE